MSKRILFECLKEKINTVLMVSCPDEKFVCHGLFNNQFFRESDEDPIDYPAVFIQFEPVSWNNTAGNQTNVQKGNITVLVHIGFKQLDKDNEFVLNEVDRLYSELQGLGNKYFTPLIRSFEIQDVDYDNVEVWTIGFITELLDVSAANKGYGEAEITDFSIRPHITLGDSI